TRQQSLWRLSALATATSRRPSEAALASPYSVRSRPYLGSAMNMPFMSLTSTSISSLTVGLLDRGRDGRVGHVVQDARLAFAACHSQEVRPLLDVGASRCLRDELDQLASAPACGRRLGLVPAAFCLTLVGQTVSGSTITRRRKHQAFLSGVPFRTLRTGGRPFQTNAPASL